jgi:ribokinase
LIGVVTAGDTFNGGLGVALAEGMPIGEAVQFAQAAAALSVTRRGAQPSLPSRQEVDQFLSKGALLFDEGST